MKASANTKRANKQQPYDGIIKFYLRLLKYALISGQSQKYKNKKETL